MCLKAFKINTCQVLIHLKQRVGLKDFHSQLGPNFGKLLSLSQVSYFCWNDVLRTGITISRNYTHCQNQVVGYPPLPQNQYSSAELMEFTQTQDLHQIHNALSSKWYHKSQAITSILKLQILFCCFGYVKFKILFYWTSFLQLPVALHIG